PAVGLDDAAGGGQAQAGAARLGGGVGAEDAGEGGFVHARAGVHDVQLGGVLGAGRPEDEFAGGARGGALHGLQGVEHEVEHGLLEVGDIHDEGEGADGQVGPQPDAAGLGLGGEEVHELVDDAGEVGGAG